jgi:thiamine kinase-like enzyme
MNEKNPTPIRSTLLRRIEKATKKKISQVQPIQGGYTPALRLKVIQEDGSTLFAKIGTNTHTSNALRQENKIYQTLQSSFLPKFIRWEDDPNQPILLLEDLSEAFWPPPWSETRIAQVMDTLPQVWGSSLPNIPVMVDMPHIGDGWHQVAENPAPFLALGFATEKWLQSALATLLRINEVEVVNGRSLLHFDLRSDNICFTQNRAIIIDWNLVCLGNPKVDLGFWLPSLEAEGGPPPEQLLPGAGEIAGLVSGFFAARAGLPTIPDAPRVRNIQLMQLKTALPWAVRGLGLPQLDGSMVN